MPFIDPGWRSQAPPLRHVQPFDGMRCVGALGVMVGHSSLGYMHGFNAFVDMFLVVSGLLITTMLLQEHGSSGNIDLRRFYSRRIIRLVPTVWFVVGFFVMFGLVATALSLISHYERNEMLRESLPGVTYTYNIFYPHFGGAWFSPLWTVSLEEQFYLIIGISLLVSLRKGWIRPFAIILGFFVLLIQYSRLTFNPGPLPRGVALAIWLQRPDSLMIGVIAAILSAEMRTVPTWLRRVSAVLCSLAGIVLCLTIISATQISERWFPAIFTQWAPTDFQFERSTHLYWMNWGNTVSAYCIVIIALAAFRFDDWKPARYLAWKPMVWIGACLSYVIYVVHFPIQHLVKLWFEEGSGGVLVPLPVWAVFVLQIGLPMLAALPIYRYVERSALRWKARRASVNPIGRNEFVSPPSQRAMKQLRPPADAGHPAELHYRTRRHGTDDRL